MINRWLQNHYVDGCMVNVFLLATNLWVITREKYGGRDDEMKGNMESLLHERRLETILIHLHDLYISPCQGHKKHNYS